MTDHSTQLDTKDSTQNALTIELKTPIQTDRPIYLAGNFNDWNNSDQAFQLEALDNGNFQYTFSNAALQELPNPIEYKYTLGGWDFVELDQQGNYVENRSAKHEQGLVQDVVPRWMNAHLKFDRNLLPDIRILSESFEIPQLIRTRRISALLPHDYEQSDKRYPVLYLQDGQNLFDDYAPFGNWGVDKKLAILKKEGFGDVIIIAIDHAAEKRIAEFTPSYRTQLGKGEGKKYVRFLADTLKPYIDRTFRTLPDRIHTGIGGSSMGGLISIYAGLMYPEVFSRLMIFSPSLWVAPNIHFHAISFDATQRSKIYLYGGRAESATMESNIRRFQQAMEEQGVNDNLEFKVVIDPEGTHNEGRWGQEFPAAIKWLFFDTEKSES
ncbi:MAG: alpha/beta hydrolase-fold protein [Bacteroidota bacterium]